MSKRASQKRKLNDKNKSLQRKKKRIPVQKTPSSDNETSEDEDNSLMEQSKWFTLNKINWMSFLDEVDQFIIQNYCSVHDPLVPSEIKKTFGSTFLTPKAMEDAYVNTGFMRYPRLVNNNGTNLTATYEYYTVLYLHQKHPKKLTAPPRLTRSNNVVPKKSLKVETYSNGTENEETYEFASIGDSNLDALRTLPLLNFGRLNLSSIPDELEKRAARLISHYIAVSDEHGVSRINFDRDRISKLCQWKGDAWKNFRGALLLSILDKSKLQEIISSFMTEKEKKFHTMSHIKTHIRTTAQDPLKRAWTKKLKKKKTNTARYKQIFFNMFHSYISDKELTI